MVKKQLGRDLYSSYLSRSGGCPDIPGTTRYINLLRPTIRDPENNNMPVCHGHLVGLPLQSTKEDFLTRSKYWCSRVEMLVDQNKWGVTFATAPDTQIESDVFTAALSD